MPDSCTVNVYDEGDCIPPHIDNHDFVRLFCTIYFLSGCNIVFGRELKTVVLGESSVSISIPLPVGSVLVLNGNGADISKHCVPPCLLRGLEEGRTVGCKEEEVGGSLGNIGNEQGTGWKMKIRSMGSTRHLTHLGVFSSILPSVSH